MYIFGSCGKVGHQPLSLLNAVDDPDGNGAVHLTRVFATGALVNLYTRDVQAGLRFYGDLLGFTETFRSPTEGIPEHVELRSNGFTVGLGTVEAARRVHGVEATPGSPAMVLVVWTDDVDAAYGHLVAAGGAVGQPPPDTGHNNRNGLLRDPHGNLVEISPNRWIKTGYPGAAARLSAPVT